MGTFLNIVLLYKYRKTCGKYITENAKIDPPSEKGKIRAEVGKMITDAYESGKLKALIARCADFYGPGAQNSLFNVTVIQNLLKNKTPIWFVDGSKVHTFTYTIDAAKATALLGNTEDSYNQVWHLPTSKEKLTGNDWIEMSNRIFGKKQNKMILPMWMISLMGIFSPVMRELTEMLYQMNRDYFFNSEKFENRFKLTPTSPEVGIKETRASVQV